MRFSSFVIVALAAASLVGCKEDGSNDGLSGVEQASSTTTTTAGSAAGGQSTASTFDTPVSNTEASRFLVQATFGPNADDIDLLQQRGYEQWIIDQMEMPARSTLARLLVDGSSNPGSRQLREIFWEFALENEDQLRQRVAFALSQIVVVSLSDSTFGGNPEPYTLYMDILQRQAFGNYGDLIREVSISPAMGIWLTHLANQKADLESGFSPDENYAREVMQLFTIGLVELNPDGTETARETYTNEDVQGLASVFTGLSWAGQDRFRTNFPDRDDAARTASMAGYPEFHEPAPKSFLETTVYSTDPLTSVDDALDHLLAHPNVPPFISKQLIQRFTTSNPSSGYVSRVASAYSTGMYAMPSGQVIGEGRRGDMKATIAAILLDPEARQTQFADQSTYGRVREPVLRFTQWARAFRDGYVSSGELPNIGSLNDSDRTDRLAQQPYEAPSVFNFYRPQYVAAGTRTATAGLVAPELQITTSATTAGYINFMEGVINNGLSGDGFLEPDYTDEIALADDPRALIEHLDTLMTYGTLSDRTKDRMEAAMQEINIGTNNPENDRRKRVRIALLMLVTTPEYTTLR